MSLAEAIPAKLNIAVLQMTSVDDVEANWQQIHQLSQELFQKHTQVDLICLPENALYLRLKENEKIIGLNSSHLVLQKLAQLARERQTAIHVGASPVEVDGKLYNSSIYFNKQGEFRFSYQKIHLFDIQLKDQKPMRESDVFQHGSQPSILNIDGWNFGESICYDIRFSELYSHYAKNLVDAILIPAAFLRKTGQAHWQILLRARAIESQCYVLAAAQTGVHKNASGGYRETYGHSMIIDPWGEVIEMRESEIGFLFYSLDRAKIQLVREQIPMSAHRRFRNS